MDDTTEERLDTVPAFCYLSSGLYLESTSFVDTYNQEDIII